MTFRQNKSKERILGEVHTKKATSFNKDGDFMKIIFSDLIKTKSVAPRFLSKIIVINSFILANLHQKW